MQFPAEQTAEALDIWAVQNVHELTHNSRLNLKIWRGNVLNSPLFMFFFFPFFRLFFPNEMKIAKSHVGLLTTHSDIIAGWRVPWKLVLILNI